MRGWARRLGALGRVVCFDYPYMAERRGRPDPRAKLVAAHRAALAAARADHPGPVVLCGKSLGGRIGCHVALEEPVTALVCFGYPLIGMRGDVRDAVLRELRTPVLFVQGTRDHYAPLADLEAVRACMPAPTALHVVETGDHSLLATRRWLEAHATTQDAVDAAALAAIADFLQKHL
jgi:predicted alpha/beta-hydrolase family hydrolase